MRIKLAQTTESLHTLIFFVIKEAQRNVTDDILANHLLQCLVLTDLDVG